MARTRPRLPAGIVIHRTDDACDRSSHQEARLQLEGRGRGQDCQDRAEALRQRKRMGGLLAQTHGLESVRHAQFQGFGGAIMATHLQNLIPDFATLSKSKHVTIDDLEYLAYECRNERAGFFWKKKENRVDDIHRVSEKLDEDIGKVWYVKPVVNSPRINNQLGEFFLFGCGNYKEKLNATFSEEDFDNKNAPTNGIARIGVLTLLKEAKKEAREMEQYLDISEDRIYPDFHHHNEVLKERYKNG